MTVISLDKICKNILLKRRYPFHYYIEFLVNAKDILRELVFDGDIRGVIRYKLLTIDDNNEAALPNDYNDWANVSARIDQYLRPLVEDNSLDTIPNYNSSFVQQPYIEGVATDNNQDQTWYSGYVKPYWYMVNFNNFGENTGRMFGGSGQPADTFKIDRTRKIIKINELLDCNEIVLEYISNGMDADSASQIDAYAQATIEQYCMWQFKENNRTYSAGEAEAERQKYLGQREILRARTSDLTINLLKRIVQKNSIGVKY